MRRQLYRVFVPALCVDTDGSIERKLALPSPTFLNKSVNRGSMHHLKSYELHQWDGSLYDEVLLPLKSLLNPIGELCNVARLKRFIDQTNRSCIVTADSEFVSCSYN